MSSTSSGSHPNLAEYPFVKMQGAGNDFVVIDCRKKMPFDLGEFAQAVCDRHFGVGSDGVIALQASQKVDFKMAFANPDGSSAICGNGMRCLAKYIYKLGLLGPDQKRFTLETDAGDVQIEILGRGDRIRIDMGSPIFDGQRIPTRESGEHVKKTLNVDGKDYVVTTVSMGNPHCVIFTSGIDALDLKAIGPKFEHHEFFPQRTNTEFVEVVDRSYLRMRVWERGAGETLACGTGVCAVLAASVKEGRTERQVTMQTRGGEFEVAWNEHNGRIYLTGPAEEVFTGKLNVLQLMKAASPSNMRQAHSSLQA